LQEVVQKNCLKNLSNSFLWPWSACWGAWVQRDGWNKEEEEALVSAHNNLGTRWADIAKLIPDCTEKRHQESLECNN
jgi:hypothetical protein